MLEANAITVHYPGAARPALDAVSCAVPAGTLVAVVGPNGSGKTTLIRALLGVAPRVAGEVVVDGRRLESWSRQTLAQTVGVVPQREDQTFPLRVESSVLLGRYPHLGPLRPLRPVDRDAVRVALTRCDAWPLKDRWIDTLSAGEWQRVRLARALAQEPRVLVLDEPTAALDVRHEMEVFELVRTLADQGLACLLVTHNLNVAARYADRLVLLHLGKVVQDGTAAQVLDPAILSEVFQWPVAVHPLAASGIPQVLPLRPADPR